MPHSDRPRFQGLCHVGMHAEDPAALAELYREVLGMQAVGVGIGVACSSIGRSISPSRPLAALVDLRRSETAV